jgi:hypothetical protein
MALPLNETSARVAGCVCQAHRLSTIKISVTGLAAIARNRRPRGRRRCRPPIGPSFTRISDEIRAQMTRVRAVRGELDCAFQGESGSGAQSAPQLPVAPAIGSTCQTLSGSCLILTSPPAGSTCSCPGLGIGTVVGTSGP